MRSNAPPGLRNKPGWSTFLIAFVTKWYSFLIAFLGRVAWFFNSAGGLVFFDHWPSFFLTFANHRPRLGWIMAVNGMAGQLRKKK